MTRFEHDRPREWLRRLSETPDGYRCLVVEAGGLARAAYRLARAQCRAQRGLAETPSLSELQAAALVLGRSLGTFVESLPIRSLLAADREAEGVPVVRPIPPPPPGRRSSFSSLKRAS